MQRNFEIHYLGIIICFMFSSCRCVEVKDLIVAQDKLCWVLYLDVVCLCDNGNVGDAVFLAATAALRNSQFSALSPESVRILSSHSLSLSLLSRVLIEQIPYIVYSTQDVANWLL